MTRRQFIGRMFQALAAASLTGSACARPQEGIAMASPAALGAAQGLSLREIAAARLHHGPERFINPFNASPRGGMGRLLHWKLFSPNPFRDQYEQQRVRPVHVQSSVLADRQGLSVTVLKHAGVLIRDREQAILIDPLFGALMPFIQDFAPLAFDPRTLPRPDVVLITHGHYDHLDLNSLRIVGNAAQYIAPLGYEPLLRQVGAEKLQSLDWFDTWQGNGREVTLLPCSHWTMRNPITGPNTALWGSYLLRTRSGATIYISGDTGWFDGFAQLGAEQPIDLAIINMGAYEPRWFMAASHIDPSETVRAFRDLRARHLMIAHWGTFRLGDEPVHAPPQDIRAVMQTQGLSERLIDARLGQSVRYGRSESGRDFELMPTPAA